VSAALAKQERSALEAILGSYQLNPAALKQVQQAPSGAGTGNGSALTWAQAIAQVQAMKQANALTTQEANVINGETASAIRGADTGSNNFDLGVIRGDTPVYAVGQSQPLFWIGQ
jgi:hypothetical protein